MTVSKSKILEGPYDATNFDLIKSSFPEIMFSEKAFWRYFFFQCDCKKGKGYRNKQIIYLSSISYINLSDILNDTSINIDSLGVYNMNTNKIGYIKGEGVNGDN